MAYTATDIMDKLYSQEINFSVCTFWDGGYDAKLGDEMNGFKETSTNWPTLLHAMDWLLSMAKAHYPKADLDLPGEIMSVML